MRSEHITKGPAPVAQGLLDVLAEGNERVRRERWLREHQGEAMPAPWSVPFARISILMLYYADDPDVVTP